MRTEEMLLLLVDMVDATKFHDCVQARTLKGRFDNFKRRFETQLASMRRELSQIDNELDQQYLEEAAGHAMQEFMSHETVNRDAEFHDESA